MSQFERTQLPVSKNQSVWNRVVPKLKQGLKDAKGYELSSIRDHLYKFDNECSFRNSDVKIFLLAEFGNEIEFTYPTSLNKSMMVFSVHTVY